MSNWIKPSDLPKDTSGLHWTSYKTPDDSWSCPRMECLECYRGDWYIGENGWQSEINDWSWRVMLINAPEKPEDE